MTRSDTSAPVRFGARSAAALSLALGALLALLAPAQPASAIINGYIVEEHQGARFVAQLTLAWDTDGDGVSDDLNGDGRAGDVGRCTGSLIHPSWVLTAAHCVHRDAPSSLASQPGPLIDLRLSALRIGNRVLDSGGDYRAIAEVVTFPNYVHWRRDDDVALLRLARPSWQPTIPLGRPRERGAWGTDGPGGFAEAYGWGRYRADGPMSDRLRRAPLRVVRDNWAQDQAVRDRTIHVAVNATGQSVCRGDSGGPLLVFTSSLRLVGVNSHGSSGCDESSTAMEVGAGPYHDWIRRVVPDLDHPPVPGQEDLVPATARADAEDFGVDDTRVRASDPHQAAVRDAASARQQRTAEADLRARREAAPKDGEVTVYDPQAVGPLDCYTHHGAGDGSPVWSYYPRVGDGVGVGEVAQVAVAGEAVYTVTSAGELTWQRRDRADCTAPASERRVVGTGWDRYTRLLAMPSLVGGEAVLYGITPGGDLYWHLHRCSGTGGGLETEGCWGDARKVGTGWDAFRSVVAGGLGVLYATDQDGTLWWYSHSDYAGGRALWAPRSRVGDGWHGFRHVFTAAGTGALYAATADGTLLHYRHHGYAGGTYSWAPQTVVGDGWLQDRTVATG